MGAAGRAVADLGQAQGRVARWSAAPLPGVRCFNCGRKIADVMEFERGRVVIKCRCKARNEFTEDGQRYAWRPGGNG